MENLCEKEPSTPTIKMGKIYLITNLINSKKYVGITTRTLEERWKGHVWKSESRSGVLHHSIRKHGKENFKIELIEECFDVTERELLLKETFYIDKYDTFIDNGRGYNLVKESDANLIVSEATKDKMSKSKTGVKNNFYGKRHSKESLALMSKSHVGSKSHLGKPHTEETKKKLSSLLSGEKSPKYKPMVLKFHNILTGEKFVGTQFHFRKKYNLKCSTLSKLVNGKTKSYRKWIVVREA